jgi:multidrug efflux pump subunit AcrA (membrane-fusion protein)
MGRRAVIVLTVIGAVGAGAVMVSAHDPHEAPGGAAMDPMAPRTPSDITARAIGLETAEVGFGRVEEVVRLTGIVRTAPERVQIVQSAVGGTLTRLDAALGQRVARGAVLGEVQSPDLARMVAEMHKAEIDEQHAAAEVVTTEANIAQLEAQIAAQEQQARLAEEELARVEGAGADGAGSGGGAVAANVVSAKRAAAIQARAQVRTLGLSLDQARKTVVALEKIRASTARSITAMRDAIALVHRHPAGMDEAGHRELEGESGGVFLLLAQADGVVTRREAVAGQGVEAGRPLLTVADDRRMLIEGELPESLIGVVGHAAGSPVRVWRPGAAEGNEPIAVGAVRGVGPTVDPVKRTAQLLIEVENPGAAEGRPALKDGMFVTLAVVLGAGAPTEDSRTVVVPGSSVVTEGPETFVYVKEGDHYERRDVLLGARNDKVVEVRKGLVPGDVVVTRGAYGLSQMRGAGGHGHDHDHDHEDGHGH